MKRADSWLRENFPQLNRRQIDEAISNKLVTLHGKAIKKGDRVEGLETQALQAHLADLKLGNPDLQWRMIQEHEAFWVVYKPSGFPSHPLSLFDRQTATQWAFAQDRGLAERFSQTQPTVAPHRLDTDTEGLLIVCKSPANYELWRSRFQRKELSKKYLAWCWGKPADASFSIQETVFHRKGDAARMTVASDPDRRGTGLPALSHCEVRKTEEDRCLVQVHCQTGVTHQVRVHLASVGLPLIGDEKYDYLYSQRPKAVHTHQLLAFHLAWTPRQDDESPAFLAELDTSAFEKRF